MIVGGVAGRIVAHGRFQMGDCRKLIAWQRAQEPARDRRAACRGRSAGVYTALRGQILGAAASVPAHLAEGCGRRSRRELARFSETAYTSLKEVESDLMLFRDVHILPERDYAEL